jgi:hypothetical protein
MVLLGKSGFLPLPPKRDLKKKKQSIVLKYLTVK